MIRLHVKVTGDTHRLLVEVAAEVEERRILQEREDLPYPVFDPVL